MKYKYSRLKISRLITYYENRDKIPVKTAYVLQRALLAKSTKQKSTGKEPGGCGGNPDYLPKSTGKEKCKSCNGTLEATDGMGNEVDCFRCNGTGFEPTRPKPNKIEEIEIPNNISGSAMLEGDIFLANKINQCIQVINYLIDKI